MDDRNSESGIRLQRQSSGWSVEGPGYYIWDEDPNEVIRAARELRRGNHGVRPTRRMLVVQPGSPNRVAGASPEALDY
jgi:hypothetical protein